MKLALSLAGLAVAGGVAALAMPSERFDPIDFFDGRSHGEGTLHELFKSDRHISVDSVGRVGKDGMLILDQVVRIEGDKPKTRRWKLRPVSDDTWRGSLTDADGPVTAQREDGAILIRYKMNGGLKVEQTLTPHQGWKTVDNAMKIRKFGITVGRLDEIIAKP